MLASRELVLEEEKNPSGLVFSSCCCFSLFPALGKDDDRGDSKMISAKGLFHVYVCVCGFVRLQFARRSDGREMGEGRA